MTMRRFALVAMLGAGADPGTVHSAITSGVTDGDHRAVGALYVDSGFQCSATLVGARTVLTAAHCIAPGLTGYRFVLEGGHEYAALSATPHPRYDPSTELADVAIVRLAAAPPVAPMALSAEAPRVGTAIAIVGLGCTDAVTKRCPMGTRRVTQNTIGAVTDDEIAFTSAPDTGGHCDGDSGGPTLSNDVVVGVHAWGPVTCLGVNHDARVDVELAWIREVSEGDVVVASTTARAPAQGCAVAPSR